MEEIKEKKRELREQITTVLSELSPEVLSDKNKIVEDKLFNFANFLESKITLLYASGGWSVDARAIIDRTLEQGKLVVLPLIDADRPKITLYKIDTPKKDLIDGPNGNRIPNYNRCKVVPIDCIDIAVVPGIAFDEKGGRIGPGDGYYDRLIPKLPITARKVAVAVENQMVPQVPMESHDKHVDIIITDERIIYKI